MLRIITHIERLLLVHDCVIVPGFGGFVLQAVSAVYDEKEHLFNPQRKEIVFNVTLQHNDGLLSESYMQMYDVNYRKAQLMLEEDVADMKVVLQEDKKLSLGVLGSFSLGMEGQVIFHPGESDAFSVGSYGLVSFNFPQLQPVLAEREEVALLTRKRKKDILYIPVNRKLLRVAAASAAAVALFLLVSTPVKDVNQAAYTASFVPTEMVVKSAPEIKPTEEIASEETIAPEINEVKTERKVAAVAPSREVKRQKITPEPAIAKPNLKMYHIVIASFPTEDQADKYIAGVDRQECKHVSKVVRDGKYRIYADKFDNREQAESYMATLRMNEKYKDAWLFISR
ncbi:HU-CCDC81 and SPOR domain-containing protein [Parabacteroides faecis]|uniref:HU domain-containing protein n=1 Tax=Parabacteroides TaxID=375288 RepID=UPI000EFEDE20|nr:MULTISPECIES: SPOR domain-containing protein [Parabacteroides]MBC8620505.1 HU-CCDC81 and SPOR domain-containing protein [Parabacteroides faecis]RHR93108.1 SPOR domain-containing protein [Parabacteroides sp. AF14-59]